ncbi:6486_t:CDS:2 [Paraglomus brasilianum]|uniref:6486_t:CDS:1 n=1 Tax=Paraglomus brasilianum TaxID=144538 RepID=A0A9N9G9H0_9GLOM|nr:6486_t:CDS:2 [Paraglomus brasilianum]
MGKLALLLITLNLLTALAVPSLFNDEEIILAPLLSSADAEVIPDQYIVVFKNDVTADRISYHHGCVGDMLSEERKKVKRGFMAELISGIEHTYNSDMFKGYSGRFSEYILNKIRQSDEVAYVEKDSKVYSEIVQYNAPWGLARISHRQPLGFITFTKYLYDATAGSDVTVYIVDTGINIDHVDFGSRARWGHTVPDNDEDVDNNGHGTHVAGTAVGTRFGVAKKANVVAVKVLNSEGRGSTSDVIKGVEYVVKSHADEMGRARKDGRPFKGSVANLSLGGSKSISLDAAINAAVTLGVHFVVAAGNSNGDACDESPAAAEKAITVGASTFDDMRAPFSNYGPCVDIFAPGKDILSAWIGSYTSARVLSGTSMAAPHVTGLVAYFLGLEAESTSDFAVTRLTPKKMRDMIVSLATREILEDVPADTPNLLAFNNFDPTS